jgi:DNA-binding winged helix-turn-helix (wHTH) protein/Tfp pilus assembly protein PilF
MSQMRQIGGLAFDERALALYDGDRAVPAARKTLELLALLCAQTGELVPRDALQAALWPDAIVEERNLAQQVYLLRKILAAQPGVRIENVPRRGYRLIVPALPDVAQIAPAPAPRSRRVWPRWAALVAAAAVALSSAPATSHSSGAKALSEGAQRKLLLARLNWERRDDASLRTARALFEDVAREAPGSSRGYGGLALVDVIRADHKPENRRAPLLDLAEDEANAALARDPSDADALASLGLVASERHQGRRADAYFAAASQSDVRHSYAHTWRGIALLREGRIADARAELETGVALQPSSKVALCWLADADLAARRFDAADSAAQAALVLDPLMEDAHWERAAVAEAAGHYRAALSMVRSIPVRSHSSMTDTRITIARLEAKLGDPGRAARDLGQLDLRVADPLNLAATQLALGRPAAALATLRREEARHPDWVRRLHIELQNDPRYDDLRQIALGDAPPVG